MAVKIKICGITLPEETQYLIKNQVDYMGIVLFYPKSKRNKSISEAREILKSLTSHAIKKVAVTVSPTIHQVREIEELGFDYIQIHGTLAKETFDEIHLPILRAFNVNDLNLYEVYHNCPKIQGYVFDAVIPGGGKTFDWSILSQYKRDGKLFILAGGLHADNVVDAIKKVRPDVVDVSSGVEGTMGKDALKIKEFVENIKRSEQTERKVNMDKYYYGKFGGRYVPESLINTLDELEAAFEAARIDERFQKELAYYLKDYVGRETPLYLAERLSKKYGTKIYLKREDLNHTGAHKINNVIGQILLAKRMGKKKVIAETGAGQHGVATATGAALFNMECTVYMGEEDVQRQALNVFRMEMLGAKVVSVKSGSNTLKDATNEAIRTWAKTAEDTFYVIGSAVGPYPYPKMVKEFQSIISKEAKMQFKEKEGRLPDTVIACVGGGSNSIGMFAEFLEDKQVELIGVEAAGLGVDTGKHASAMALGKPGTLHGMRSYLLQDTDGNVELAHSISAGLDYPGVGPEHAYLRDTKRVEYVSITDAEAMEALKELCELEGIIPAIESAHALAYAFKKATTMKPEQTMIVCLSGRGDKDVHTVSDYFSGKGYLN